MTIASTSAKRRSPFPLVLLVVPAIAFVAAGGCKLGSYAPALTSIQVTPGAQTIARITTQQFTAIGRYSDDTEQDVTALASWDSSDGGVATVSGGLATPNGGGSATITATVGGVSGSATLNVTNALLATIDVTPAGTTIQNGTTLQLTATGHFDDSSQQDLTTQATWTSDSVTSVAVGNGDAAGPKGLAKSVVLGDTSATLTATFSGISGSTAVNVKAVALTSIAVSPATKAIIAGQFQQFTATGTFDDGSTHVMTREVTWISSDTNTATVNATTGVARGVAAMPDPVSITATSNALLGSVSGSASLTVQTGGGGY